MMFTELEREQCSPRLPVQWFFKETAMSENTTNGENNTSGSGAAGPRYIEASMPKIFNDVVALLTKAGVSVLGSRVLSVRGRKSGEWRSTPVNLLTVDGVRYLVAPRGQTQWVRNLRVAGNGTLRVGRRVETFVPTELDDAAKPAVLRAYLKRWKFEVGMFFDGVDASASDEELLRIAPGYPIFVINTASDAAAA
jgi:deazaflavin-dependent oxidoreductase (nitroreductase family)